MVVIFDMGVSCFIQKSHVCLVSQHGDFPVHETTDPDYPAYPINSYKNTYLFVMGLEGV